MSGNKTYIGTLILFLLMVSTVDAETREGREIPASGSEGPALDTAGTADTEREATGKPEKAGMDGKGGPPPQEQYKLSFESVRYAEAGHGALDVTKTRVGAEAEADIFLSEQLLLKAGIEFDRSFYNFDGLSAVVPGARERSIDRLDSYGLKANFLYFESQTIAYFSFFDLSVSREPGADLGESVKTGGVFGVQYSPSRELGYRFGIAAFTRLEDSPMIIPALGLEWRPDDKWEVLLGVPETGVTYNATPEISLFARAHMEFHDYRLDEPAPLDDAVLRDDLFGLELGAEWEFARNSQVGLFAGLPMKREFTIDDDKGHALYKEDLDRRPFFGASLQIRF